MAKYNWVEKCLKQSERVFNLRKFFEITHLDLLSKPFCQNIAYRKLGNSEKSDIALLAWAQKAKLEARKADVKPINIAKLNKIIPEIKSLTLRKTLDFEEILKINFQNVVLLSCFYLILVVLFCMAQLFMKVQKLL